MSIQRDQRQRFYLAIPLLWAILIPVGHAAIVVSVGGCTLNDAVVAANTNTSVGDCEAGGTGQDTILLDRAGGLAETTLNGELLITSSIRIESNNSQVVTVRGAPGGSRVFHVDGGDLVLGDVRIVDGIITESGSDDEGGGLRVIDGSATLFNCAFYNNFVPDHGIGDNNNPDVGGDAVYAENSEIEISDCTFAQNGPPSVSSRGHIIGLRDSSLALSRVETRGPDSTGSNTNLGNRNSFLIAVNSVIEVRESGLFATTRGMSAQIFQGSEMSIINSTVGAFPPPGSEVDEAINVMFGFRGYGCPENSFTFLNSTLDESVDFFRFSGQSCSSYPITRINSIWNGPDAFFLEDWIQSAVAPLQDNGGPIETMALFWNSAAINAGDDFDCPEIDQRGRTRVRCDAGAYEFIANSDVEVTIDPVSTGPYVVGESAAFDVNIANLGPDTANGVAIDINAQNFNIDSVNGACVSTTCGINTLEADNPALPFQTARVVGTPTFSAGQNGFTLNATAIPGTGAVYEETDNNNNSDSLTLPVVPNADLRIEKTLITPPPYAIGGSIEYSITISNNGPDFADNVVFSDTPVGLDITGITGCSNPPFGPCEFTSLGSGSSIDLTVTAEITQPRFDNTGSVSSDTFDSNPSNNVDNRNNGADVEADADTKIGISRETSPPFFTGQTIEYKIRVSNLGPDTATNVTFDLEAENFFLTAVLGPCSPSGSLPCNIGNLAPGSGQDVTVQGFAVAPGSSGFTAFVDSDQQDADPGNNVDDASAGVVESADVSVELAIDQPSANYARNQILTYVGRIQNAGDDYADNIALELAVENLEILGVFSDSCTADPCTISTLARPASELIIVKARILELGSFDLTASVDADQFDPVPANNTDDQDNGGIATINDVDEVFDDSFGQ